MEEFIRYLEGKIKAGRAESASLAAEGRNDDADFAKVKTNIYDVAKTVSLALMKRPGAGVGAIGEQFERFRTGWGAALEKAKAHDDARNVAVEETKLAALEDVIARFREVTGA